MTNPDAQAVETRSTMRPRIAVIFNPVAGSRKRRHALAVALRTLRRAGCRVMLSRTSGPGDAGRMAGSIARAGTFDAIMVAGGDGTLSDVAHGIALAAVDKPPALAVLPLGTANVMALEIGLPMAPAAAASAVAAMRTIAMPLARVGARHFLLMAGAGFDAHVVAGVSAIAKRRWGKFAYVLEMLRQLRCFPFDRYRVNVDGTDYDAASVVVSRGRFYGGRFLLAPDANLARATLHVCLFGRGGRAGALLYAVALGVGLLSRSPGFRIVEATRVTIEGAEGEPVQGDGDSLARLPVVIEMTGMSLPLVVP